MSYTYKDNTAEFQAALKKATERGLKAIGMAAEGNAKREITKKVYSRGNNDKKYRLTGRLRNSITFAVSGEKANIPSYTTDDGSNGGVYEGTAPEDKGKAVYIGSNVEYAPYVELGTVNMRARPFLRPAATEHAAEYKRLMEESIKHA